MIGLYKKHWGDAEMRELVEMLPMCAEATELDICNSFHEVTAEGVGVLTRCVDEGKLPAKLKTIDWPFAPPVVKDNADGSKELRAACERRGITLEL